jgi:site-specific DNA recombinase
MKNVIIYSRVTTEDTPLSLEFQEAALVNYCKEHNYNIIKSYKEAHSGKSFERPKWLKMRTFIETNENSIQSILVLRFDRFCRNSSLALKEMDTLNQLGVSVKCIEN